MTPPGALARMPCSGVTVPGEVTVALPAPTVAVAVDAAGPITAIEPLPASGSTWSVFLSSTVLSSATVRATRASAALATSRCGWVAGSSVNIRNRYIWVRMRTAALLITLRDSDPSATAAMSGAPK